MHRKTNNNIIFTLAIIVFGIFSTIAINQNSAFALSPEVVTISQLGAFDAQGQKVTQVQTGQQVSIRANITNNLDMEQPFMVITEVRDGLGVTVYLAWHSGKVKPNDHYAFETSWMVDRACWYEDPGCNNYEIRSFAITGLENPQVLSPVKTVEGGITVIDTTTPEGSKLYRLEIAGKQQYDIEYSLEGGHITKMGYDVDLATIWMQLYVSRDSMLSIQFPNEFIDPILCKFPSIQGGRNGVDIEAFVDTIPADVKEIDNGDSVTWQLKLEKGTEQVELVGCMFL